MRPRALSETGLLPAIALMPHTSHPETDIQVRPDVFAVRTRAFVGTAARKAVVAVCQVDKSNFCDCRRKIVVRRIVLRSAANQYVLDEHRAGKIGGQRLWGIAEGIAPADAILIVRSEIVSINKTGAGVSISDKRLAALKGRVMVNNHIRRPVQDLKQP